MVVNGGNNIAKDLNNSTVIGSDHYVDQLSDVVLQGEGMVASYINSVQLNGKDHHFSHVFDSVVDGESLVGFQINNSTVSGYENFIIGMTDGGVFGNNNSVFQGDGQYFGSDLFHLGTGSPMVIGNNVRLIGHQNHVISGDDMMSIGVSDLDLDQSFSDAIVFYAEGGVDIVSGNYTLAHLAPGSGSWSHVSDRHIKSNVLDVNHDEILDKIVKIPVSEWRYKGQKYVHHIGPMAQDFYTLFGYGSDERYIQMVDIDGVILSGVQAIGKKIVDLKQRHNELSSDYLNSKDDLDELQNTIIYMQQLNNNLILQDDILLKRYEQINKKEKKQQRDIDNISIRLKKHSRIKEGPQ